MASSKARGPPPTLPLRQNATPSMSPYSDPPPSYDSVTTMNGPWTKADPRTSSQQSLVPSESDAQNERRKLLLIYIHGFMGNETSFRHFPAHVHHILTVMLAETHVVHTKIYPRYRSKRHISFARDDFSTWLEPHEDPSTDVILFGHSMGGLLAAEVVLMPPSPSLDRPLKHKILGTINFDVPFLGMHPGVVRSGLASIFKPAEETHEDKSSPQLSPVESIDASTTLLPVSPIGRQDTLWQPLREDTNFNQPFPNDVVLPVRKGWSNVLHFVNKHSNNFSELTEATRKAVSSHLEFGGAMANYNELRARYGKIRALEEQDGRVRKSVISNDQTPPRVRFVNYYTASTGKLKRAESPLSPQKASPSASASKTSLAAPPTIPVDSNAHKERQRGGRTINPDRKRAPSPSIGLEEYNTDGSVSVKSVSLLEDEGEHWEEAAENLTVDTSPAEIDKSWSVEAIPNLASDDGLPPMQDLPPQPEEEEEDWDKAAESLTIDFPLNQVCESPAVDATSILSSTLSATDTLPPIPDLPQKPQELDVSFIKDKDTRKLVEKEHTRAMKAYEKAVKDRESIMRDRSKLEEKRRRNAGKDAEKAVKDTEKAAVKAKKDAEKARNEKQRELTQQDEEGIRLEQERQRMEEEARRMRGQSEAESIDDTVFRTPTGFSGKTDNKSVAPSNDDRPNELGQRATASQTQLQAPPKDRKFCILPPKDSSGQRDPCWVRVFMKDVDEVGAHCGLFFVDERYERLVGDVAERVESWVREEGGAPTASRAEKG